MKIALIFYDISIQAGGQRQFLSLAQKLQKQGNQVVIYATKVDRSFFPGLWEGLDVRVIKAQDNSKIRDVFRSLPALLYKVMRELAESVKSVKIAKIVAQSLDSDFDVMNCHEGYAYQVGYFYKIKNPKARIVWTLNNAPYFYIPKIGFFADLRSRAFNFYKNLRESKFFRAIDMVAVLSVYEEEWCKKRGLPVTIVRSGIDFDEFYAPVRDIVKKEGHLKILSVGALGPHRRFEDTLMAFVEIRKTHPSIKVLIICREFDGFTNKEYKEKLISIVRKNGMEDSVEFKFQGATEQELKEAYKTSDIFVFPVYLPPPQGYGWGLIAFEAMAAGVPIILCKTTGAAAVLNDGVNALLVDPMRPDQIAEKIRFLLHPTHHKKIAAAGQALVRDNISWDKYAENMTALFRS